MRIDSIVKVLQAEVHASGNSLAETTFRHVVASDLMSDVLVARRDDFLLVTSLASDQMVRTADLVGSVGVVLVNGKLPPDSLRALAQDLGLLLLSSPLPKFEACLALGQLMQEENRP